MPKARYAIGIDLGTTNCSLAYVDREAGQATVELLELPQWEGEGLLGSSVKLPSFVWFLPKSLVRQKARLLPWQMPETEVKHVLGREARLRAVDDPDRVAFAAKSWLSVGASSTRQAPVLPWGSGTLLGEEKLSPLAVQSLLLQHLKQAWNARFGSEAPFHEQAIVITVPASFDELAQRLTLEAASSAAYPPSLELLEEPQAAFYDWFRSQDTESIEDDRTILVVDVGGGTSDFTLLRMEASGRVERLRVSEHLLLGGDNIDLALADRLRQQMEETEPRIELTRSSWQLLLAQARQLKEDILSQPTAEQSEELLHVSVPLQAQNLFGPHASTTIKAAAVRALILEGFFPAVASDAAVQRSQSGLRQFGLPFVQDTAITRHLAAFLAGTPVDALLCAGGTLSPAFLQASLAAVIRSWQGDRPLRELSHPDPDLAIARGAAWYAWQKLKGRKTVESRYPRSIYVELGSDQSASQYLCLLPQGQPRGQLARIEAPGLYLRTGQRVAFQFYSSLETPAASTTVSPSASWQALPTLSLELPSRAKADKQLVPIALEAQIRETGVLEIACRSLEDESQSWTLDFTVDVPERRLESGPRLASEMPEARLRAAQELLQKSFAKNSEGRVERLPRQLEELLGSERDEWSLATLRALWEPLQEALHRRQRSVEMESTWLYLAGFSLRPGWGAARDPERIKQIWPLFEHGASKSPDARLENQWWLFWRRVAGGLSAQQQSKIIDRLLPQLRKDLSPSPEIIRLAAALERAPMEKRVQLGRLLAQQIANGQKDKLDARIWALARISSRFPLAAGPEAVVPPHIVEEWAEMLKVLPLPSKHYQPLKLFYSMAGRLRGEPALDIDPLYRQHFAERLRQAGSDEASLALLFQVEERSASLDQQLFGESLPSGFVLLTH